MTAFGAAMTAEVALGDGWLEDERWCVVAAAGLQVFMAVACQSAGNS